MKKIVFFTGAGISAESGIKTFRGNDGLWENHKIEDVATPEAWSQNPDLVTRFYNERRRQISEVQPNKAHDVIVSLEESYQVNIITQNIDDLHERAGSTNVLHLHGNIRYAKSSGPDQQKLYKIKGWELTSKDKCKDNYRLRPHVVWFGEEVPAYEQAIPVIQNADILVVIGTSLQVYPAAGLINYAKLKCKKYIIDPNEIRNLAPGFKHIQENATTGIQKLKKLFEI